MPVQFGRSAFISVSEETTYGTESGGTYTDMRLISSSLQKTIERARKTHLNHGTAGFVRSTFDGFNITGGNITGPFHYAGNGDLLKAALGDENTTGVSSPYTHSFTPLANPPSLTIRFYRGSAASGNPSLETFKGCMISTFTLACNAGEEATFSAEIIAQDAAARAGSATTPSFPASSESMLHHQGGSITYNSNTIKIRSFELVIDNKLERRNFLGQQITEQPTLSDVREVRLTVTADLEDNNFYTDAITSPSAVTSNLTMSFIGGTSPNQIDITLYSAVLEEYSDNVTGFGRIERSMTFLATVNGSSEALKVDIINGNASAL